MNSKVEEKVAGGGDAHQGSLHFGVASPTRKRHHESPIWGTKRTQMARWAATIKKLRAESMKLYRHELEHGKEEEEGSRCQVDYHEKEDTQQQLAEEEEEEEGEEEQDREEEPAEEQEERPTPKTNRGRKQITTERQRIGPSKGTHPKKYS